MNHAFNNPVPARITTSVSYTNINTFRLKVSTIPDHQKTYIYIYIYDTRDIYRSDFFMLFRMCAGSFLFEIAFLQEKKNRNKTSNILLRRFANTPYVLIRDTTAEGPGGHNGRAAAAGSESTRLSRRSSYAYIYIYTLGNWYALVVWYTRGFILLCWQSRTLAHVYVYTYA